MKKLFIILIMLTVSLVSMGQKECVVNLEKSGKLGSVVNKKDIPYITKLTIKGGSNIELIEKDWKIIQKMTSLETLDLTGINKRIWLYRYCPWIKVRTVNQNIRVQRKR